MKCVNCGHEFSVGRFCPNCGTPAAEAAAQNSLAANYEEQPVTQTEPAPVAKTPAYTYQAPVSPVVPAKRKFPRGILVLGVIAVLVLALVIAGLSIYRFGPANRIVSGAKKVLDSETFNFEITLTEGRSTITMNGTVEFKPEEGILNLYMEGHNKANGSKITMGIYEGESFSVERDDDGEKWYSYGEVDEDELDDLFEYYLDYSKRAENIFDPFNLPSDKKDILFFLEELDDATDGELSEVVDLDILADCISEYLGAHNDKKWLKENAGFSTEKKNGITYYTYEPNLYELASASWPYFEEACEDEDDYEDVMDAIDDSRSDLKRVSVEVSFGVKSGYLTSVLMYAEGMDMELTFSDFGKAELDYDELEDLASECEKGYKSQYDSYYGYD